MLEYLRKASDKLAAKILMGLLIFSFVGWGVASWILGEGRIDDSILSVGNASLKIQTFEGESSRAMNQLGRDAQRQIYSDKAARAYFSEQILSRMTTGLMLRQRADDLGLRVPNAQIARIIRAEPAFQTNGKFDMGRFNALLYQAQITEDAFSNSIRSDVLREMVTAGISEKMPAPGFMTDAMYRARHATRDIEFATIKFADFKVAANPTDEQLRETYAKNPKLVTEARKVSYVLVPAKINQPDSFEAGYKTAQALEDALIGGEPMDAAAKRLKAKFVSLPKLSADAPTTDAVLQIANVFEMEQGIESPILETKDGFAIVRVDEIIPEHNASFESVKKDLVAKWRVDEQKKQAYEVANQRLIKLNAGDALAGGKSATVGRANGAPTPVLAAAFGADVGTRTIVPGADAFYVLNVRAANAPKADAAKRTAIKTEADNMLNRAIADDYMGFLQREYPIKINQRIYKRLFGN